MSLPEHTLTVYDHPEPHSHRWSDLELEAIKRYAEAYALQAVQTLRPVAMTEEQAEELSFQAFNDYMENRIDDFEIGLIRKVEAHHHITQKEQG